MNKPITVTQPYLPSLEEFVPYLEKIWESKQLTNNGLLHQQLEKELAGYLGVEYISVFANGTLALMSALQALDIKGEVITTPYSFVATTHSLWWNKITPVFVDIEPAHLNLDPDKIQAAITPETSAIMPVHVYGNPCNIDEINKIAKKNNLKVLYDAAHAFGVKRNGDSILNFGDLSVLSFHATKIFSTIEGGAIVCHSKEMKHRIDNLKNFGFRGELVVEEPGINAKMNEVQAAFGLLQLKSINQIIDIRKEITELYRRELKGIPGIRFLEEVENVDHNYSYFPIFIGEEYSISRDELYELFKTKNIFTRRYFYPLISSFTAYKDLPSSNKENLQVANKLAEEVLCLPIYPELRLEDVVSICRIIFNK